MGKFSEKQLNYIYLASKKNLKSDFKIHGNLFRENYEKPT
tara:strand:- start:100 stop:219 length:120 start_codon:yes stop_codon:yes gene_type:complete